jgi:hypothetical protein
MLVQAAELLAMLRRDRERARQASRRRASQAERAANPRSEAARAGMDGNATTAASDGGRGSSTR